VAEKPPEPQQAHGIGLTDIAVQGSKIPPDFWVRIPSRNPKESLEIRKDMERLNSASGHLNL
jgi:hypothetical protein